MQIAVCISGIAREWKICKPIQDNYLRLMFPGAKFLYFISTCSRLEADSYTVKKRYGKQGEISSWDIDAIEKAYQPAGIYHRVFSKNTAEELCEQVGYTEKFQRGLGAFPGCTGRPKELTEDCPTCGHCSTYTPVHRYCCHCGGRHGRTNALPMLANVYMADKLRQNYEAANSTTFDWCVRTRFDNSIEPVLDLSILNRLNDNTVAVPRWDADFWHQRQPGNTFLDREMPFGFSPNDQFGIGRPGPMATMSGAFLRVPEIAVSRLQRQGVSDLAHYWVGHRVGFSEEAIIQSIFSKRDYSRKDTMGNSKRQYLESLQRR